MAKYVAVRLSPRGLFLDGETALILNGTVYENRWEAADRAHRQQETDAAIGPKSCRYVVLEVPDSGTLEV